MHDYLLLYVLYKLQVFACNYCDSCLVEYVLQAVKAEIDKQLSEEENDEMSEAEKNLLLKGLYRYLATCMYCISI